METLQIIVLFPLLGFSMPANAGIFFEYLTEVTIFDLLETETEELMAMIFDLPPENPINAKFEMIGIETGYFINNLGSFVFVLTFKLLLLLLWVVFYPL